MKTQISGAISVAAGQLMATGLTQITTGLKNAAADLIDTSESYIRVVSELSRTAGISTEETSRLIQVSDDYRVSTDDLSLALKTYSQFQTRAGISTNISTEELARLSDEYLKLAPGTARNSFLLERFGRAGLSMAFWMEQGRDKILAEAEAVDKNLIVTKEAVEAQRQYELALDDLGDQLDGVKTQLGLAILPVLRETIDLLKNYGVPALKAFVTWFTQLPAPVRWVVVGLGGFLILLSNIGPALLGIVGIIQMFAGAGGLGALGSILPAIGSAITAVIGAILSPIGLLIAAIALLTITIIKFGPAAYNNFIRILTLMAQIQAALWNKMIGWFRNFGQAIVKGIGEGIGSAWNWLVSLVQNKANELLAATKKALGISSPSKLFAQQVGVPSAQGIGEGFSNELRKTASTMQIGVQGLVPAGVGAGNMSVGHIEYHGSFSEEEMNRLDKSSKRIARNTLLEAIR